MPTALFRGCWPQSFQVYSAPMVRQWSVGGLWLVNGHTSGYTGWLNHYSGFINIWFMTDQRSDNDQSEASQCFWRPGLGWRVRASDIRTVNNIGVTVINYHFCRVSATFLSDIVGFWVTIWRFFSGDFRAVQSTAVPRIMWKWTWEENDWEVNR